MDDTGSGAGFAATHVLWPAPLATDGVELAVVDFPASQTLNFSVLQIIHARLCGLPVVILGPDSATDRVVALELGADDYVSKPYRPRELAARAKAILRARKHVMSRERAAEGVRVLGHWQVDLVQRRLVSAEGAVVRLRASEALLLHMFMDHPRVVFTRDQIQECLALTNGAPVIGRSADVFVNRLRAKLGDSFGEVITTVRGKGYMFRPS